MSKNKKPKNSVDTKIQVGKTLEATVTKASVDSSASLEKKNLKDASKKKAMPVMQSKKVVPVTTPATRSPVIKSVLSSAPVKDVKPILLPNAPKIVAHNISKTVIGKVQKKKNVMNLPLDNENYFVYLNNPLEYRRHLLESSRKLLFCLKNHQNLLLIRKKKFEELKKLRNTIKELLYLNKKFKDRLPKYNTTALGGAPAQERTIVVAPQPVVAPISQSFKSPIDKTELDRLEESLAAIELKLKNLQ